MPDRKMYFSITLLMFACLFLFQLSGVSKQVFSDYTRNRFAEEAQASEETGTSGLLFDPLNAGDSSNGLVVWLGNEDTGYETALEWCTYRHYALTEAADIDSYWADTVLVLVGGNQYESCKDAVQLAVEKSIPVVFSGLPDTSVLQADSGLRDLLGISEVRGDVTLRGVRLQEGFLLGGGEDYVLPDNPDEEETRKQDLNLSTPWYVLGKGTQSFLTGLLSEEEYGDIASYYLPALVWRHSTAETGAAGDPYTSAVYAVSASYLQDETGLGILTGIEAGTKPYYLYPVVNGQSFVLADFPSLSSENEEQLIELYSRRTESVVRDIVWPGIETILDRTEAIPSYMIVPFLEDPGAVNTAVLDDYMQRIRETKGEAGISLRGSAALLPETIAGETSILKETMPDYLFSAAYGEGYSAEEVTSALQASGVTDVRTLVLDGTDEGEEILSCSSGDGTAAGQVILHGTGIADSETFASDLRKRSLETALGYSVLTEDLGKVLYPEDEEDEWQNLSEDLLSTAVGYWDGFEAFEKTAASETGERARAFLTGNSSFARSGDFILLRSSQSTRSWYVLRLYGEEPVHAEGGSFQKIEEGCWLVTMDGTEMTLEVAAMER